MAADHHFVPAFHLRRFYDAIVPKGQEPWLWIADFTEQTVRRRSPANAAKIGGYYRFEEYEQAGGEPVESVLNRGESVAAVAIRRLLSASVPVLDGQDRADVLFFMALSATRVPAFRKRINRLLASLAANVLQASAMHYAEFERSLRQALAGQEWDLTPGKIEEMRQWVLGEGNYTIHVKPSVSLWLLVTVAIQSIYPEFETMVWEVLHAGGHLRFITSDVPVSWVDPGLLAPWCYGLVAAGVEVTFPLSPTTCVLGTRSARSGRSSTVDDRVVKEINTRQIGLAGRFAFADHEEGARWALVARRKVEERVTASSAPEGSEDIDEGMR